LGISAGILGSGCAQDQDDYFQVMLETTPGLLSTPIGRQAPQAVVDQTVRAGDLLLGMPADWKPGVVSVESEENDYAGYGQTLSLPLSIPNGAEPLAVTLYYREEESWLRHPPPGMLEALKHGVVDPEGFLKEFPSDFALIQAAYNTVPADLSRARGKELVRRKGLLIQKRYLPYPVRFVETPRLRGFIYTWVFEPSFSMDVFDRRGVRRGTLLMRFHVLLDAEVAERLCLQLLAGCCFADEQAGGAERENGGRGRIAQ
jgi:hypothetical protein